MIRNEWEELPPFEPPYKKRMMYSMIEPRRGITGDHHIEEHIKFTWEHLQYRADLDKFVDHLELIKFGKEMDYSRLNNKYTIEYYEVFTDVKMYQAMLGMAIDMSSVKRGVDRAEFLSCLKYHNIPYTLKGDLFVFNNVNDLNVAKLLM